MSLDRWMLIITGNEMWDLSYRWDKNCKLWVGNTAHASLSVKYMCLSGPS